MSLIGWTDLNGGAFHNGQLLSNKKRWCLRHERHGLPGLVTHTCSPNAWEKSKSKGQLGLHNKFQASLGYMLRFYLQKPNQEDQWYGEHYKGKHASMNRIYSIGFNYFKFFKKAKREKQKLSVVRTSEGSFKVGSLFLGALWRQTHHTLVETHKLQQSKRCCTCGSRVLTGYWSNSPVLTQAITDVNSASCRRVFSP